MLCPCNRTNSQTQPSSLVFLKRWKDSVKHRQYFEKLSENCAKDLGLKQLLETHDFRQLMDMDYVEEIDRKILRELSRE